MSVYLYGNKYQKGYENLNLGFFMQVWSSDFQNSECVRITSHGFLHLSERILVFGSESLGSLLSLGLVMLAHVFLSGIWSGWSAARISRGPLLPPEIFRLTRQSSPSAQGLHHWPHSLSHLTPPLKVLRVTQGDPEHLASPCPVC